MTLRAAVEGLLLAALTACGPVAPKNTLPLTEVWELPSTCQAITLAAHRDAQDRPFLYVAAKDAGLWVYDLSGAPTKVASVALDALHGLHVMNLSQEGTRLGLALGNTFGTAVQAPGFALVDVADPAHPSVLGLWFDDAVTGGTGIALLAGTRAYVGAMGQGLVTLDLSDPAKPNELSRFLPPLDFPEAKPDASKINARGLALLGTTAVVCDDAGGVRLVDVTDAAHPKETAR